METADYKTYLINKVQQDINNTRKRLSHNKVKILLKQSQKYIFLGKKKGRTHNIRLDLIGVRGSNDAILLGC